MEPQELSDEVERVLRRAQARVGPDSIGATQYHTVGEPQKFEAITIDELFEMMQEEVDDFINYGVMLQVRLERLRKVVQALIADADSAGIGVIGALAFTPGV